MVIEREGDIDPQRTIALCKQAEVAGFSYAWFFDSHVLWQECYTMMAACMLETETLRFGPCVTNPEKIICVGLNYRKHAAETGQPVPSVPILFNKFNNALNHHGGAIAVSEEPAEKFDYEAEPSS